MELESTERLATAALKAREHAYAPYSHFRVGAAVLAGQRIFVGCNVENASFGLTICAERSAVFAAVAAGYHCLDAVAIASDAAAPTAPCGACRQVLYEFGPDMVVILHGADDTSLHSLSELLPLAFGPDDLAGR